MSVAVEPDVAWKDLRDLIDEQLAIAAAHSIQASAAPAELKSAMLSGIDDWLRSP